MKGILRSVLSVSAVLLFGVPTVSAQGLQRDDLFGPDKLWTLHMTIGAKEYDAMQPKGGGMFFNPFGKKDNPPSKKKDEPANTDTHKNNAYGIEFPWAKGDLEFADKLVKEVGVRYKGNSTYQTSANGLRRPLKIDINHYHGEQKLFGLGSMYLGNGVFDPSRVREALGYSVFRAAKVPAPRTAFVKLYLTVPTKHDKTYVGLYTLIEPVDKTFLKKHFQDSKGMLLKPEKIQGLPYLGEKWSAYENTYNPKREPSEAQKRRLIEFTKFVNQADDATFAKKIGSYLDVDQFLRFAAANSLIANLDSFFGLGHNYFLYLDAKSNRFHFMPWDVDLAFGSMNFGGGDPAEWAIAQPYTGKNRLTERVLAIKQHDQAYRGHLKTLVESDYSPKALRTQIAILQTTVKDALAKEPPLKGTGFMMGGPKPDLSKFVAKRAESVAAQLDGKSQGRVLAGFGFGGPGPGGGKGGPGFGGFGMGNMLAKPIIEVVDINKNGRISHEEFKTAAAKLFTEAGGNDKTAVDEDKLIDTINRLMPAPKGFGGFKAPAPPKGFGPGKGLTGAILKHANVEKEKKITRDQWTAAADALFRQWDKDKSGLDEKRLVEGINQFIPPPQFGPGPGFGDPKKGPPPAKDKRENSDFRGAGFQPAIP
jgi:spore coat protein H